MHKIGAKMKPPHLISKKQRRRLTLFASLSICLLVSQLLLQQQHSSVLLVGVGVRGSVIRDGLWAPGQIAVGNMRITNGIVSNTNPVEQRRLDAANMDLDEPPDTSKANVQNAVTQLGGGIKFLQIFPNANVSYDDFIRAMSRWDKFCGEFDPNAGYTNVQDSANACKRELAAFFAHIIYDSNRFDEEAMKDQNEGLVTLSEPGCDISNVQPQCIYKDPSVVPSIYEDVLDAQYFGRGPLLTSGVRNYAGFGAVKTSDIPSRRPNFYLRKPESIDNGDALNGWDLAFWDWMTPKNGIYSAHEVMTGHVFFGPQFPYPSFGSTIDLLGSDSACGNNQGSETSESLYRSGYYTYVLQQLQAAQYPENSLSLICDDIGHSKNWFIFPEFWHPSTGNQFQCELQTGETQFSLFAPDAYKRCVCENFGQQNYDCPHSDECWWMEDLSGGVNKNGALPDLYLTETKNPNTYTGLINPGIASIDWVFGCLIDGWQFQPTEIHMLTLKDDPQNLISSGDPTAETLYGTHTVANDPYMVANGINWNLSKKYIAAPLGQRSVIVSNTATDDDFYAPYNPASLLGTWTFHLQQCIENSATDKFDCARPRTITLEVKDPCAAYDSDPTFDFAARGIDPFICPSYVDPNAPSPAPTPTPTPVVTPDPSVPANTAPYFEKWQDHDFHALQSDVDDSRSPSQSFQINLPQPKDDNFDQVSVSVDFGTLETYADFQESSLLLSLSNIPQSKQGLQKMRVKISDGALQTEYDLFVYISFNIKQENSEELIDDDTDQEGEQDQESQDFGQEQTDDDGQEAQDQTIDEEEKEKIEEQKKLAEQTQEILGKQEQLINEYLAFYRAQQSQNADIQVQDEEELKAPEAAIVSFSENGKLTLKFSQDMINPAYLSNFQVKGQYKEEDSQDDLRQLQEIEDTNIEKQTKQKKEYRLETFLFHKIQRGAPDSAPLSELGYKVNLQNYKSNELILNFIFENPLSVSIGSKQDQIVLVIMLESMFTSRSSLKTLQKYKKLTVSIPKQFPDQIEYEIAVATGQVVQTATNTAIGIQLIVTLILAVTLKSVWNLNHVMQVMAYYRLLTNWSANCAMIMLSMHNAVTLENVNKQLTGYFKDKLAIVQSSISSKKHEEQGLTSSNFFESFAIYGLILALLLILLLIYLMIRLLNSRNKTLRSIRTFLYNKLFYNSWIRYMIESNLKTTHNTVFFLYLTGSFATLLDSGKTFTMCLLLAIIVLWPVFIWLFLSKNQHRLAEQSYRDKFGSMYLDTKTGHQSQLVYHSVFCLRRLSLVLGLYFFKETELVLLFYVMFFQSAYFLYIVIVKPHEDPVTDKLEFLNESLLTLLGYTMFGFLSNSLLHPQIQWNVGYLLFVIIITIFICNYFNLVKGIILKVKIALFKRKRKMVVTTQIKLLITQNSTKASASPSSGSKKSQRKESQRQGLIERLQSIDFINKFKTRSKSFHFKSKQTKELNKLESNDDWLSSEYSQSYSNQKSESNGMASSPKLLDLKDRADSISREIEQELNYQKNDELLIEKILQIDQDGTEREKDFQCDKGVKIDPNPTTSLSPKHDLLGSIQEFGKKQKSRLFTGNQHVYEDQAVGSNILSHIDFSEGQKSFRSSERNQDWYDERLSNNENERKSDWYDDKLSSRQDDVDQTLQPDGTILYKRQTVAGKKSPLITQEIEAPGFTTTGISFGGLKKSIDSTSPKNQQQSSPPQNVNKALEDQLLSLAAVSKQLSPAQSLLSPRNHKTLQSISQRSRSNSFMSNRSKNSATHAAAQNESKINQSANRKQEQEQSYYSKMESLKKKKIVTDASFSIVPSKLNLDQSLTSSPPENDNQDYHEQQRQATKPFARKKASGIMLIKELRGRGSSGISKKEPPTLNIVSLEQDLESQEVLSIKQKSSKRLKQYIEAQQIKANENFIHNHNKQQLISRSFPSRKKSNSVVNMGSKKRRNSSGSVSGGSVPENFAPSTNNIQQHLSQAANSKNIHNIQDKKQQLLGLSLDLSRVNQYSKVTNRVKIGEKIKMAYQFSHRGSERSHQSISSSSRYKSRIDPNSDEI